MAQAYSVPFFGNCILFCMVLTSCNSDARQPTVAKEMDNAVFSGPAAGARHFRGAFSNGMKGDSIYFDISTDGKRLENLVFKGYWRCAGRLEQTTAGPEEGFVIADGKVAAHISEPPGGGSTAWRFELEATLAEKSATGTFRMNINNAGCDTYKLQWMAVSP